MNWVNLVLITVVVMGSSTDLANAANPGRTRAAPCAESFCSEVQRRFGNFSSAVEQVANKLLDTRCEMQQNATLELLEHELIRKASKTQDKKFDEIGGAFSDLRSRISDNNDATAQKYASLESFMVQGFSGMETALEQKVAQLERRSEERFRTISQNYDDMSQMLKAILETVTNQNNGKTSAIHLQTQKREHRHVSKLKGEGKKEAKPEEASKTTSAQTNGFVTNNNNLMRGGEKLDKPALGDMGNMEEKLEKIAKQMQNVSNQYQKLSRVQEVIERVELTLNTLTDRIPQNASKILETLSNEVQLIVDRVVFEMVLFVSNERYSNVRMVTNLTNYFPEQVFPKDTGIDRATFKCKVHCEKFETCQAFNIIEKQDSYVCEMLPDNLCLNQTKNALINWPGSTLWEKTKNGKSCLEEKFPGGKRIPCEILKPGCFGDWPQCSNCSKTCKNIGRNGANTLWPEGDGPFVTPIFGYCNGYDTLLCDRQVDIETGQLTRNFIMSFHDMHRLTRLRVYREIWFYFSPINSGLNWLRYRNPTIGTDGTLSDFTFQISNNMDDFFQLNHSALKPTPFVNVTDDRYGCGSFWLLDVSNATYCPGGQVSMLGEVKMEHGKIISTGMSIPESITRKELIRRVKIVLEY